MKPSPTRATAVGTPRNDVCGTGSTLPGTSIIPQANASLLPNGTRTLSVGGQIPANAPLGSRIHLTSDLTGVCISFPGEKPLKKSGIARIVGIDFGGGF